MKTVSFTVLFFVIMTKCIIGSPSVKIVSGDISLIKNEKIINIEFKFDNMKIDKFPTEQDYIKYYVNARNKKNPGSGEQWEQEWKINSREKCPNQFVDQINKEVLNRGLTFSPKDLTSNYKMIVRLISLSKLKGTGGFTGREQLTADIEVIIVDNKNPNNIIAKIMLTKINGKGYGLPKCMEDAFGNAGQDLGEYIIKQLKKTT